MQSRVQSQRRYDTCTSICQLTCLVSARPLIQIYNYCTVIIIIVVKGHPLTKQIRTVTVAMLSSLKTGFHSVISKLQELQH